MLILPIYCWDSWLLVVSKIPNSIRLQGTSFRWYQSIRHGVKLLMIQEAKIVFTKYLKKLNYKIKNIFFKFFLAMLWYFILIYLSKSGIQPTIHLVWSLNLKYAPISHSMVLLEMMKSGPTNKDLGCSCSFL